MGLYEYRQAESAKVSSVSFDTIIMTAILKADTANLHLLTLSFPGLVKEVKERYNNPGGMTDEELRLSKDEPKEWLTGNGDYPRGDGQSTPLHGL